MEALLADFEPDFHFTAPAPLPAHGLLKRLSPLMLVLYRRRDAREIA